MAYGLTGGEIAGLQKVFAAHPEVEKAVLFGSRARGDFQRYSDIDLALFGGRLDLARKWELEDEIDTLLLPYKTDLALAARVTSPVVAAHIRDEGVTFYERAACG